MGYETISDVAVFTMDHPPVNGLGHALRSAIFEAVERAKADSAVSALVLIGSERAFSAGADIREFNTPASAAEPRLRNVIGAIEACDKPVVAAISGACLGGGLELALGCHYRVVGAGAKVGLPEVKLGILPGAGGAQRLPRLVGLARAAEVIIGGEQWPAEAFKGTRLFDAFVEGDLKTAAVDFAREAATRGDHPRVRDLKVEPPEPGFFAALREKTAAKAGRFPAPMKCVDALEASLGSDFESASALEAGFFMELVNSTESKALRHIFFGERQAARIPDVPADTPQRTIHRAGVIGAGTMGGGITMSMVNAGVPVILVEANPQALEKGLGVIRANYEGSVKRGRLSEEEAARRFGLISPTTDFDALAEADLVIEAVFEEMGVKQQVFERLDAIAKPGAILASNTSTLDVDRIAGFTRRPEDVVGMHFFSPANVMRLLEVVRGKKTAKDVLATVMAFAQRIGKLAVVSGVCDGFIGNRMLDPYRRQGGFLVDEGALPQQVDGALERWGMAMGPYRMGDLAGLDIGWAIRKRRALEQSRTPYSELSDRICELGRFGQKTGKGWYLYKPGDRTAYPDPEIEAMAIAYSAEIGLERRAISDDEIIERCIFALVNEGAKILEEGIASSASDIDMVWLNGYGFPAHRGGPMFYADTVGLPKVVESIKRFAAIPHGDPAFWTPAPLLARLAADGKTFN